MICWHKFYVEFLWNHSAFSNLCSFTSDHKSLYLANTMSFRLGKTQKKIPCTTFSVQYHIDFLLSETFQWRPFLWNVLAYKVCGPYTGVHMSSRKIFTTGLTSLWSEIDYHNNIYIQRKNNHHENFSSQVSCFI